MRASRLVTAGAVAVSVPLAAALVITTLAPNNETEIQPVDNHDTLREAAPSGMVIGAAVAGGGHHLEESYPDPFYEDEQHLQVLAEEFSSVTHENQMKWDHLRPSQNEYNFDDADAIIDFAEQHGQDVRGHALFWHSQNPDWVENGNFSEQELRDILQDHVETVVDRYAGRVDQWDVVNEIYEEDGSLRTQDNIWIRELGEDIIADVFHWAHDADPSAELYLNDYNVEGVNAKSTAYYELAQDLRSQGVPVDGFGAQTHLSIQYGFPHDLQQNLERFDQLGMSTALTEVDVRMQLSGGEPTQQQLEEQADYYAQTLEACLNVSGCNSWTTWGISDKYSWVPNTFEGEGAANIMDDDFQPKPAYYALLEVLGVDAGPGEPTEDPTDDPTGGPGDPEGDCTYTLINSWDTGFQAEVEVTNTGDGATSSWGAEWSFPSGQQIDQLWNGEYTQSGANVSVSNMDWNAAIDPGQSVTFGFLGSGDGDSSAPGDLVCTLN